MFYSSFWCKDFWIITLIILLVVYNLGKSKRLIVVALQFFRMTWKKKLGWIRWRGSLTRLPTYVYLTRALPKLNFSKSIWSSLQFSNHYPEWLRVNEVPISSLCGSPQRHSNSWNAILWQDKSFKTVNQHDRIALWLDISDKTVRIQNFHIGQK